jgi:hypothetical protein
MKSVTWSPTFRSSRLTAILPRPFGALSHHNNRGPCLSPPNFHMEER